MNENEIRVARFAFSPQKRERCQRGDYFVAHRCHRRGQAFEVALCGNKQQNFHRVTSPLAGARLQAAFRLRQLRTMRVRIYDRMRFSNRRAKSDANLDQ
jgi:hypothetical protein